VNGAINLKIIVTLVPEFGVTELLKMKMKIMMKIMMKMKMKIMMKMKIKMKMDYVI